MKRPALSLAALAALSAVTGCQPVGAPALVVSGGPPPKALAYGHVAEVQVDAAKDWQPSGAVLTSADTYRITASGQWSIGAICGVTDADARGITPFCANDVENLGFSGGVLIGRIGPAGQPFMIGSARVLKADADGELFLRSYDWLPTDNYGALTVRIAHDDVAAGGEPVPPHRDPL